MSKYYVSRQQLKLGSDKSECIGGGEGRGGEGRGGEGEGRGEGSGEGEGKFKLGSTVRC